MDADRIIELFAGLGPVTVRRMFGGTGIYADGMMFAIAIDGDIYFKADERTVPDFEREGLKPFTYRTKGDKTVATSYWRMPDRLYDDPDELAHWATGAVAVAQRAAARKTPARSHRGVARSKQWTGRRRS